MTIFDSTGTMRVKLFTKQIEFILHSTKAKLKHMFDAVLYNFMNFTLIDNMTKLKYNVRCNFQINYVILIYLLQVHDRVLLRSKLLTRVRNAYIFVFHPLHLSAYIVDYVTYVDWAEECAYLFK